jgi:hypothetical protein
VTHNSEQDIIRVLTALRDATPRHGEEAMQHRLFASLKAGAAEQEITSTALWRRPIFWTGATLATCLLLLGAMHLTLHNATTNLSSQPDLATNVSSRPDLATNVSSRPDLATNVSSRPDLATNVSSRPERSEVERPASGATSELSSQPNPTTNLSSRPKRSAVERPAVGVATAAPTAEPTQTAEAALLADTTAPSHPAPPMPLTPDERLLVRAARHTEQTSVAQLEPLPRPSARDSENRAIEQFIQRNLASLALAESFNPTPAAPVPEEPPAPADPPTSNGTSALNDPPN